MILDALNFQRRQLDEQIESHTQNLVRGTPSRDEDQRVRGIIRGLQVALQVIEDVEDRLRKANENID
jgi:hypothetical protein